MEMDTITIILIVVILLIGFASMPYAYGTEMEGKPYEKLNLLENEMAMDTYNTTFSEMDWGLGYYDILRQIVVELRVMNYLKVNESI